MHHHVLALVPSKAALVVDLHFSTFDAFDLDEEFCSSLLVEVKYFDREVEEGRYAVHLVEARDGV